MLNSLVFNRCHKRRNKHIQTLPSEPFRPILVKRIRIGLSYHPEQGQLMLPFGPDNALLHKPRPDLRSLQPPVRLKSVLLFVECKIQVPPVKERHDSLRQIPEKLQFPGKIAALQDMRNIPPDIDGLYGIMIPGKIPLKLCKPIRQIRRTQRNPVFPQMVLVPGQRIIIEGISTVQIFCSVGIQQMKHQQNIVHVLLVKDRQIVNFFLVREKISDRPKGFCPPAHIHDHKKL